MNNRSKEFFDQVEIKLKRHSKVSKATEKKNIKLIQAYRYKPILWDLRGIQSLPADRNAVWEDIANTLNMNNCKKSMTRLLSTFRSERRKLILMMKNGDDMKLRLRIAWYGFKHMAFLLDKDAERERQELEDGVVDLTSEVENIDELLKKLQKARSEYDEFLKKNQSDTKLGNESESSNSSKLDSVNDVIEPSSVTHSMLDSFGDEDSNYAESLVPGQESSVVISRYINIQSKDLQNLVNTVASELCTCFVCQYKGSSSDTKHSKECIGSNK